MMKKRKNMRNRSRRVSIPRQRRVSYKNASEYAKKLKRYSLINKCYVYVYEEQARKDSVNNVEE